ncbi:MAG: helix-turn-helix transcriptional regulator [Deltaproteobacteria bacterium]|nr:helix-turn-helix transcriptional regulator [Deltaproteobacteria bacterium]
MSNNRDDDIEWFAEIFKALSNPNRLKIFLRLITCCPPGTIMNIDPDHCEKGCACVGELSTLSHHIKELRRAGLIRMQRRGQKVDCFIDPETLKAVKNFFS